ncbi:MAG: DUF1552 domain-containing protein [Myxococcales bacterium]|nr:DUF1552 domain-containing protein [Myxococcales bacterium]
MKKLGRRMWLRGAGGFALAIPLLPSLLEEKEAKAGTTGRKRFVAMGTNHGAIWQQSMYPNEATLTQSAQYAGRAVRRGGLELSVANGVASLSPVLSASSDRFTSALAAKMNVLRGLDVTFYLAHHRGGHLGNYAENDGNGTDGQTTQADRRPTIDQVLAWSPSFYPDLATILERALVIGGNGMSANWSSPSTKSGTIQNIAPENDSLALFNRIFVPEEDPAEVRPPIVDRVLEDYKRLRNGNRRLSTADKQRLDDHLDRLDELQRKINVQVSCGDIEPPTKSSTEEWASSSYGIDPVAQSRFWQLQNDVIAAAFACDTSRIATMFCTDIFSEYVGDWHQDVAHQAHFTNGEAQATIAAAHQRFFENVFLDLVAKLDAIDDTDGTVLDSTLIQWTQESGCATHDPIELPVVTAGSAGGFFTTGSYADYRNLGSPAHQASADSAVNSHNGLVYNQWLGNVLQAMGLDPSEYESGDYGGYGKVILSTEGWYAGYQKYGNAELSVMSEILPFLKA